MTKGLGQASLACFFWTVVLCVLVLVLLGCVSPQFPKDAYIKGGESQVSTPWGSAKVTAEEIRTGKAVSSLSK